ncbi:VOC family protein [Actinoplanes sp. NPDC051494]|uniref:VOC family protein n=1 Tax=Actinoplanes sp. NPDC051494 TaxID=3363907 RepID=UPI0037BD9DED
MDLVSARIITQDVARLVAFYEKATGTVAQWANPEFAKLTVGSATLAIGSTRTVPGLAEPGGSGPVIIEFLVDDVDAARQRRGDVITDVVYEPTTMPWGNRSLLFRDPDGNLVNFFRPL